MGARRSVRPAVLLPALLGALALCAGCHHDTSGLTRPDAGPPDGGGPLDARPDPDAARDAAATRDAGSGSDAGPANHCGDGAVLTEFASASRLSMPMRGLQMTSRSWAIWQFEVMTPLRVQAAGFTGTIDGSVQLEVAITALSGPTPELRPVATFGGGPLAPLPQNAGPVTAAQDIVFAFEEVTLEPGWYAVGLRTTDEGVLTMLSGGHETAALDSPGRPYRASNTMASTRGGDERLFVRGCH